MGVRVIFLPDYSLILSLLKHRGRGIFEQKQKKKRFQIGETL